MRDAKGAAIAIDAPAKVNLYLHITGRRADGYHELDSLFVRAGVADRLSLHPSDSLSLDVAGPFASALSTGDNLVLAAARRLADEVARLPQAAIHLDKNLPVAAGLGGGSADAAAALAGLARLWQVRIGRDRLLAIAAELGADVPACLERHPLQVSGIGERLRPAPDLPPVWLVLVNPGLALPTADVFRKFDGGFSPAMPIAETPADAAQLAAALRARCNDLEPAAVALAPDIAEVLQVLRDEPGVLLARMSGSGATCFGLTATGAEAAAAAQRIGRARPGWWVAAAPVLTSAADALPLGLGNR